MTEDAPSIETILTNPLVGVDGEGCEHYFDQYRDTVYVLDDDQALAHVEQLAPGELGAWIDYVDEQRGWTDCRYVPDGGVPFIVEQLATLVNAQ